MSDFHRDHVPNPRAPRKAALWALLTGESLTAARQALVDDKAFRAIPPQDLMRVQGFVTAGSALPGEIRQLAQEVADGLAQSEPPHWPGLLAEMDCDEARGRPLPPGETHNTLRWHPDIRVLWGLSRVPGVPDDPDQAILDREALLAASVRRDTHDETGRHDNGRDHLSVLGRVRATPASPVPRPHLRVVWSRPEAAPKRGWGERFDYGVLVASVCIVVFFSVRAVLTSALFEALTR